MPKYLISRASQHNYDSPCPEAVRSTRPRWVVIDGRETRVDEKVVWEVEAQSIDELFARYGALIVTPAPGGDPGAPIEIEVCIYDDWVE